MENKILAESAWDYSLESDAAGNLIFEVVCGTVGIYTIRFILNEDEINKWKTEGTTGLRHLAYGVRDYPEEYIKRKI